MASFTERIKILLDVDSTGAETSFKKFRSAVADADTTTGKFKAGAGAAMDSVKANAGAMALGAGAAIAGFALKAAVDFTEAASAAQQMANTMGSAPEEASRLLAVLGPLGVELGDTQDVFNNLASLIDANDESLKTLGVTIAKDASGRVDMNESFLRIVESLGKVQDPARRAALAAKFFGEEGARQFGPLIAQSEELREKLAAVSDEQVFDAEEIKKAERMREAQKQLSEALKRLTMTVGEAVAGLAPYIQSLVKIIEHLEKIPHLQDLAFPSGEIESVADEYRALADQAIASGDAIAYLMEHGFTERGAKKFLEDYNAELEAAKAAAEAATPPTQELAAAIQMGADQQEYYRSRVEAANDEVLVSQDRAQKARDRQNELNEKLRVGAEKLAEYRGELDRLMGTLNNDEAYLNLQSNIDATIQKIYDVQLAANNNELSQEENLRQQSLAWIGLKKDVIGYGDQIGLLPDEITTLVKLIDDGQIEEMERRLGILTRNRTMNLSVIANGGVLGGFTVRVNPETGFAPSFDSGGVVPGPRGAPQLIMAHGGETVLPTHKDLGARSEGSPLIGTMIVNQHEDVMAKMRLVFALHGHNL